MYLIFLFGLIVGNFLSDCIFKIPKGESMKFPCLYTVFKRNLNFFDSLLRRDYEFFKSKETIRCLVVELFTGLLYILIYKYYGTTFLSIKYAVLVTFLIVISFIDYDTQDVYIVTTYPAIFLGIIFALIEKFYFGESLINYSFGILIPALIIFLISKLTGAMGSGDIDIHSISGVFLGWKLAIINIFLSFITGGIIAILAILFKRKKRGDYIAFGPAIGISTIILIFFGSRIIPIYFPM